jgi:hypothetical protein
MLALAERQAAEGALPDAAIRNGRLVVTPLKNATPEIAHIPAGRAAFLSWGVKRHC